jgi:hypothetical protein
MNLRRMLASFARILVASSPLRRQISLTAIHYLPTRKGVSDINSFDLNYWILGNEPSNGHLPSIRVGKKMTVKALKEAIMEKEQHRLFISIQ